MTKQASNPASPVVVKAEKPVKAETIDPVDVPPPAPMELSGDSGIYAFTHATHPASSPAFNPDPYSDTYQPNESSQTALATVPIAHREELNVELETAQRMVRILFEKTVDQREVLDHKNKKLGDELQKEKQALEDANRKLQERDLENAKLTGELQIALKDADSCHAELKVLRINMERAMKEKNEEHSQRKNLLVEIDTLKRALSESEIRRKNDEQCQRKIMALEVDRLRRNLSESDTRRKMPMSSPYPSPNPSCLFPPRAPSYRPPPPLPMRCAYPLSIPQSPVTPIAPSYRYPQLDAWNSRFKSFSTTPFEPTEVSLPNRPLLTANKATPANVPSTATSIPQDQSSSLVIRNKKKSKIDRSTPYTKKVPEKKEKPAANFVDYIHLSLRGKTFNYENTAGRQMIRKYTGKLLRHCLEVTRKMPQDKELTVENLIEEICGETKGCVTNKKVDYCFTEHFVTFIAKKLPTPYTELVPERIPVISDAVGCFMEKLYEKFQQESANSSSDVVIVPYDRIREGIKQLTEELSLQSVMMSLPPETADLPPETADLPTKTADLPPETAGLPPETAGLPPETADLPSKTAESLALSLPMEVQNNSIPVIPRSYSPPAKSFDDYMAASLRDRKFHVAGLAKDELIRFIKWRLDVTLEIAALHMDEDDRKIEDGEDLTFFADCSMTFIRRPGENIDRRKWVTESCEFSFDSEFIHSIGRKQQKRIDVIAEPVVKMINQFVGGTMKNFYSNIEADVVSASNEGGKATLIDKDYIRKFFIYV